tara:strand:- start:54707 stop:55315 length:609 start_codon:yes stop_codon:yes gene_type:complete
MLTLACIVVALALLYPGLTQPVLTLDGTLEKSRVAQLGIEMLAGDEADTQSRQMLEALSRLLGFDQIEGQLQVYSTTRSIQTTVQELADGGNGLVALLIVFFCLVIPVFKLLLQLVSLVLQDAPQRRPLLSLNSALSKWSMSDVFVMGLLVAFMAGKASGQMGDMLNMSATLESGFYYFLAYCLFAIGAGLLLREPDTMEHR